MKWILTLLCVTALIPLAQAAITMEHQCSDSRCTEGTPINYSIKIFNNIDDPIEVRFVKIRDIATRLQYAAHNLNSAVLQPGENNAYNFTSQVVAPFDGSYTAFYQACFGVTILREDAKEAEVCSDLVGTLNVLPLDRIECTENSQCGGAEACDDFFRCEELACNSGFILNHQCVNYGWLVLVTALAGVVYFGTQKLKA